MLFAFALSLAAPPDPPAASPPPRVTIAPATIDDTLEVTGDPVRARQVRTRMTVGVMVNGRGPYRFLVDSGADRSVVGAALARQLALPTEKSVTLHGMAGTSRVGTVRVDRLAVGSSRIEDVVVPALAEGDLGAQGLLGIDALAGQRVMLDFDSKTITVQDTRRPLPPMSGRGEEIIVTARRRKGQLILTEASVGRTDISAVVDTGAEITIGNMALHAAVFRSRRAPKPVPVSLISVTGQTLTADLVVLPEVRIGGLTLRNVTMAFADVPPFALFGLAEEPSILLGTDVLETFRRVSLDFRRRKIRFLLRGR